MNMITRRIFLKNSGLALVGMGAVPSFVFRTVLAAPGDDRRKKVLITVFQRGGMDGLNTVVPFGEKGYYSSRPTIAIPAPQLQAGICARPERIFSDSTPP